MYAVIKTGGKQYRVAPNDVIKIERMDGEVGSVVSFDEVLLVGGDSPEVGAPKVDGASVAGVVLEQSRADKIIVFKKKRRQNYRRKKGHRQHLTVVRIAEVLTGGKQAGDYADMVNKAKSDAEQRAARKSDQSARNAAALERKKAARADTASGIAEASKKKSSGKAQSGKGETGEGASGKAAATLGTAAAASAAAAGAAMASSDPAEGDAARQAADKASAAQERSKMADEGSGVSERFTAPAGKPDNLTVLAGVGDGVQKKLIGMGITKFEQIANFTDEDIAYVDDALGSKGRVEREDWVAQSKKLAAGEGVLFDKPADGAADDLTKIEGVDEEVASMLNDLGLMTFGQIADLKQNDINEIDERLELRGAFEKEDWVAKAKALSEG